MENIIAVFNNRNNSMQFASILKRMGVNSRVVSTPRELSVSCGVSVIVRYKNLKEVRFVINRYGYLGKVKLYAFSQNDIFKTPLGYD